jgi:hemerythrin
MTLTIITLNENKQKIAELINSFSKTLDQSMCKNDVLDFLHKVSFYTENFFINEELFLKKYEIPSYKEHVEEHKLFVTKMIHFQERLEKEKLDICKELHQYLNNWYNHHVLKNDKEIIEFIEKHK